MMNTLYRSGCERIAEMRTKAEDIRDRLNRVKADNELSPDAKARKVKELRDELASTVSDLKGKATSDLDTAERWAVRTLSSSPSDPAEQANLMRASSRVAALLQAGEAPGDIAQVLSEAGDADGLLSLREQVPTWTISAFKGTADRQRAAQAAYRSIDQALRPHVDKDKAAAIDVRLGVEEQRDRLNVTAEHALAPTPHSLIRVAYADAGA